MGKRKRVGTRSVEILHPQYAGEVKKNTELVENQAMKDHEGLELRLVEWKQPAGQGDADSKA